jgi:lysophosphatidate acyltransferase
MRRIVSVTRFLVGFAFVALASTLTILIALPLLPWRERRIKLCNYYGKIVGSTVVRLAGGRPVFSHRERLEQYKPAIYVSNHCSTIDLFASMWICPVGGCGVAKKEVARVPFFGWLYWLSGHLLIDRSNRDAAIAALKEVGEVVNKHNLSIWIWPEGTRSRSGRLQPFKKGFVHLAIATGRPVVPVVVHGAHTLWRKKELVFVPGDLQIDVLPAIDTSGWTADDAGEHAMEVYEIFAAALKPEQQPLPEDTREERTA